MKIRLLLIGKTDEKWLAEACEHYIQRITHYIPFNVEVIPDVRNAGKLKPDELKRHEAEKILKRIDHDDFLVLLDEHGEHLSSKQFSNWIDKQSISGVRNLTFLVAGAFGADKSVKERARLMISLSKMTFPHQLVRVIFLEQLYRAMTISRNEKYHNE